MARETTKHGPRTDQALQDDLRRHRGEAEEGFSTDGQATEPDEATLRADGDVPGEPWPPEVRVRPDPPDDPTAGTSELRVRQAVLEAVADAGYPATREDLLRHVGPDERGPIQAHLRSLPAGLVFESPEAVASAFGGIRSGD
jgi:hypothetical protein